MKNVVQACARLALVPLVGGGLVVAGVVAGAGTASAAPDNWGAFALGSGPSAYGGSGNYPTQAEAEQAAKDDCGGGDCETVLVFRNECAAMIQNPRAVGWGRGPNQFEAERNARINAAPFILHPLELPFPIPTGSAEAVPSEILLTGCSLG